MYFKLLVFYGPYCVFVGLWQYQGFIQRRWIKIYQKIPFSSLIRNVTISNFGVIRSFIKDIDEEFFAGVESSLVTLSLQYSKLTYVPRGINKITSLKSLDLQGNNISELYPYSFYGASIAHLSLGHNVLITLSENAFLGLEGNLKSLNLKSNLFKTFPMSAVRNLQNLEDLNLGKFFIIQQNRNYRSFMPKSVWKT